MKKYIKNITKLSLLAIFAISINAEYKLGKDYRLVDNPLPVKKDRIVEVTESFWYGCNHCYSFEPAINSWKANQGPDTKLVKMPITWGGIHQLHAALYFTIESLKLDPSTHSAVFVTIHKEGNFLQNPKAIQEFLFFIHSMVPKKALVLGKGGPWANPPLLTFWAGQNLVFRLGFCPRSRS